MYQAIALAKCLRKRIQYVDRWVKPLLQSLVSAPRLLEFVDLVLEYSQNSCRRVTRFELAGERVCGKILIGRCFICLEGFCKDGLEIGRGCCRCGSPGTRSR